MIRHNRLLVAFHVISDALLGICAFIVAYAIRFHSGVIPITKGLPPLAQYLNVVPFIAVLVPFGFADAYAGYTAELWAGSGGQRRLNPAALNAFYRLKRAIPRGAQLAARRLLIRWQGSPEFPRWPFDASVAASSSTALSSSSTGTTRAKPMRWASSALTRRPVIISSSATFGGMERVSGTVIMWGQRPTSISGVPNWASSAATTRSQARARPKPPARA